MGKRRKRWAKVQTVPPHRGAVILTDPCSNIPSMPGYRLTTTPPFKTLKPETQAALIQLAEAAALRLHHRRPLQT